MSFGKRRTDKHPDDLATFRGLHEPTSPTRYAPATWDKADFSRVLVFSVAGVILLAAISALFVFQSGRNEPIEVEASLIDGTTIASASQGRVVQMCVEQGLLAATRGEEPGDEQRPRISQSCECTVGGVVAQLTPLQMQMLYVDYRAKLRATIASIDRTGETVATSEMPVLEKRDGAPVALITAASYATHWRDARGLVAQQSARCQP